jgi:predicted RNA-binding protein with PUA-like domain
MNYWLVKFAPFRYSWNDCLRYGRFEIYSVRNPQARNNLRTMQLGDLTLFYHSQTEKQVMGIMKVIDEAHQDPTTNDSRWLSVTFEPIRALKQPVTLSQIKAEPELFNIGLVKQQRLAVMPLSAGQFNHIVEMEIGKS